MRANGSGSIISGFVATYVAEIVFKAFRSDRIGGIYAKFIAKSFGKV